jgi:hypothetical protein
MSCPAVFASGSCLYSLGIAAIQIYPINHILIRFYMRIIVAMPCIVVH